MLPSIVALLGFACAAHASPEPIKFTIGWQVSLNAAGRIERMTAIENARVDRVPQIRARLEQAIREWRFVPGAVDGKPSATETGLSVQASLMPPDSSGNVAIRIDHAGVGGSFLHKVAPKYPPSAVSAHETGEVVVRVAYDADGNVTSAVLNKDTPPASAALVAASLKAARTSTFRPEVVGGHALAGVAVTPFCYRLEIPGLSHLEGKCDWTPPGKSEAINEGEAMAVNPAASLLTDVAGSML
ncbi:MAG: TonB family protein [Rudaea sp.]